jgi:hypothetical protein
LAPKRAIRCPCFMWNFLRFPPSSPTCFMQIHSLRNSGQVLCDCRLCLERSLPLLRAGVIILEESYKSLLNHLQQARWLT